MKVLEVIAIFQKAAGTSVFCAEVSKRLNEVDGVESVIAVPDVTEPGMYEVPSNTRVVSISDAMSGKEKCVWSPHGMLRRKALMMKRWKKLAALVAYQWWDLRKASVLHVCSEVERKDIERLHLGVPFITVPLGVDIARNLSTARVK